MDVLVSEEVRAALAGRVPLVVGESSVLAQGLPFPDNLAAVRASEAAVRAAGAVPAMVAVLAGRVRCGLSLQEAEALATAEGRGRKIGARDLAPAVAARATGGTTVSATCAVAAALGLPVFATGGIGGVHLGDSGDVSEDLHALSRFSGMVVCAGAKSVLDLSRTLEALESLGVLVVGYRTGEFPAFYEEGSGLPLSHRVEDVSEAARTSSRPPRPTGPGGGAVVVRPPPEVLGREELKGALLSARTEAAVRPFPAKP